MNNSFIFEFLKKNNFFSSKKLGQNFLIQDNIKKNIVNLLQISDQDYIVEIGPGLGSLTDYLIKKTKNISIVEIDKRLYEILKDNYLEIDVINQDILKLDMCDFINQKKFNNFNFKIISNLPYSFSSQIIFKFAKFNQIKFMVFMIQKEMANRLVAKKGSKEYNHTSIFLSTFFVITKHFDVSNNAFVPKPSITSTVITLERKNNVFINMESYEKFLKKCFNKKRKTIINNLKFFYNSDKVKEILQATNIEENLRPEQIDSFTFLTLFKEFQKNGIN